MSAEARRVIELDRKQRENFISERSLLEKELTEYRKALLEASPDTLAALGFNPEILDAKTLFPSLYKSKYSYAEYAEERKAYAAIVAPIVTVRKELLARADSLF